MLRRGPAGIHLFRQQQSVPLHVHNKLPYFHKLHTTSHSHSDYGLLVGAFLSFPPDMGNFGPQLPARRATETWLRHDMDACLLDTMPLPSTQKLIPACNIPVCHLPPLSRYRRGNRFPPPLGKRQVTTACNRTNDSWLLLLCAYGVICTAVHSPSLGEGPSTFRGSGAWSRVVSILTRYL